MRILQLCKKSPTPQKDGESIAIHQITKALCHIGASVDVLAMLTTKHPNSDKAAEQSGVNYTYLPVSTEVSALKALINLPDKLPYIVSRFQSEDFENALVKLLKKNEYDFIILEGVFLGLYLDVIKEFSRAKVVLRAHNIESQIWKRLEEEEQNGLKKVYLKQFEIGRFEQFERKVIQEVEAVISISPVDNEYFVKNKIENTLILPVCVEETAKTAIPEKFNVGFLGGMDWLPNRKGIDWFLENVWSKFVKDCPEAIFNLAGRNFPEELLAFKMKGVNPQGEIDNAHDFIASQSLMIVPIFSGSGMRVKIIEAMSLGKAVLSTKVGAEGIKYQDGIDLILADDVNTWLDALRTVYKSPSQLNGIGAKAKELVEKEYLLTRHADKLLVFLDSL